MRFRRDVVSKVGFGLIAINDFVKMAAVSDQLDDGAGSPRSGDTTGETPAAD